MKVAFFDLGTNSIHMKIVEIHDDLSFEVLEHERDMTRIGEGSFGTRKLSKRAARRALKVLERFLKIAREIGVKRTVAVATSAVRDARNGRQFVREVRKKTGLRVSIISGKEEARLIFLGASSGLEKATGKLLAMDIGGGSAEFVLGNRRSVDFAESLPLGVARLTDRFISKDPPSKDNLKGLGNHIEEMIEPVAVYLNRRKFSRAIGTGGTMINLAAMVYEMREKRRLRLRGYFELHRKALEPLRHRLVRSSVKKIRKMPGLDKKRAATITAGSVLVETMMQRLKADRIFVSDKGIREGMILDFMMKKKKWKRPLPSVRVQWFGQKPFFSGRILERA